MYPVIGPASDPASRSDTPAVDVRNFGPNGIPYGVANLVIFFRERTTCPYVTHVDFWPCPRPSFLIASSAHAQAQTKPFEPTVGQAGKDVVWVPTPQTLVERMLDLAKVTPQDFLMDLGSGDGRTVITAAKRGATAQGIEYNPDMVALSQRNAKEAGVTGKATFVKADLFETDFSKAQVVTMFLLPSINLRLRPEDPGDEAGHARRVEHVHDGRLDSRTRPRR